jgi:hypothetical protein
VRGRFGSGALPLAGPKSLPISFDDLAKSTQKGHSNHGMAKQKIRYPPNGSALLKGGLKRTLGVQGVGYF